MEIFIHSFVHFFLFSIVYYLVYGWSVCYVWYNCLYLVYVDCCVSCAVFVMLNLGFVVFMFGVLHVEYALFVVFGVHCFLNCV